MSASAVQPTAGQGPNESAGPSGGAGPKEWAALGVLMLPVLLISIDNTVLSFALPAITEHLAPTGTGLLWIVDIYPLLLAGLLVPMGGLGDRIGRRRLLMIGAAGFGAVSLLAAYSTSSEMLTLARALLGVFGATLMPSTLSLLRNIFTDRRQRRLAIAIWATGFAGGGALGPILGGVLLEHFWWGAIFLINVPVMALLLPLGLALVPESKDPMPGPVDWPSVALAIATMLPIVFGIKRFAEYGVTTAGLLAIAVGLASGVFFVRRQLRRRFPMIDVRLFGNPVFAGAVSANLLSVLGFAGFLFFVAQFLQLVVGLSPLDAGLALLPALLLTAVAGLVAVRLVRYLPANVLVGASFGLSALGYLIFVLGGQEPTVLTATLAFAVLGIGIGLAETLTNDIIVASVPAEKAGAASAISETAYEVGSTLGIAVLGSVLTATYRGQVEVPSGVPDDIAAEAGETLGGAVKVAGGLPEAMGETLIHSAQAAFDLGIKLTTVCGVVIAVGAAVVSFLALRGAQMDD